MARITPGIEVRHSHGCPAHPQNKTGACTVGKRNGCTPTYRPWVYSARLGKKVRPDEGGFPTLAAAKGWRVDALHLDKRRLLRGPSKETLREAAEAWLEGAESGAIRKRGGAPYKPATLRSYRTALDKHVLPELGHLRVSEVTRERVQRLLVEAMQKDGADADSIHNAVMPLRVIYRRLVEDDQMATNPTANLRLPARDGSRERVATPEEAKQLLDALPQGQRALWATAFYAGLRRGELQALRVSDVDLAAGTVSVTKAWDEKVGTIEPKSRKGTRRAPIVGTLRDYLVEHIAATGRSGEDFIFGTKPDRPFAPSHVRRIALAAWAEANKKRAAKKQKPLLPIGLHECRHTCVSIWHDAGLSLERIGDYVGHSSTYMTDRYRHLLDGHEAEAAAVVQAYLDRADTAARLAQVAD
jgi:integrase